MLVRIIKGWWRFLFGKKSEMARDRLIICRTCPHRKGYFCSKCGCVLVAKAEIEEEECPELLWPEDWHKSKGAARLPPPQ